ncbi:hypothetical protein [Actinomadura macrotermitis]|uniref:hypothetical protein n=1 Tax=Actinomadura macrotermitis TaxID=2585200 RepID=UPI001297EA05|nr:hypothetical protein [Actinomadura macrotermitis]
MIVVIAAAVAGMPPKTKEQPAAASSSSRTRHSTLAPVKPAPRAQPSAQQLAARLARKYRLPNPRSNTPMADIGSDELLTTDRVSIYRFRTVGHARRFAAAAFARADAIRVGRFVLNFAGRRGADIVPAAERARMAADLRRLLR